MRVANIAKYFGCTLYNNKKIVVAILYLKILLDKKYFKEFYVELKKIFLRYKNKFKAVSFSEVLKIMGIEISDFERLI